MLPNRALAPTSFFSGPEEKLAAADVYEIKSSDVINNIPAPIEIKDSGYLNELRGAKAMLTKLPILNVAGKASSGGFMDTMKQMGSSVYKAVGGVNGIKDIVQTAKTNPASLLTRVAGSGLTGIPGLDPNTIASLGSILSSRNVPQAMQGLLNSPIPSQLGAFATMNGLTMKLPVGSLDQAFQMGSLINSIVPGSPTNIADRDMTARLIGSFAVGGMSTGIPNAFSSTLPLANGDNAIITKSCQVALNYACGTGNISGMKDVVNAVGKENLAGAGKGLMTSFAKNFQSDTSAAANPGSATKDNFTDITASFAKLDESWMRKEQYAFDPDTLEIIPTYPVIDISLAREGSQDFRSTMMLGGRASNDTELQCFTMAGMFDPLSPEEELEKNFPMTFTSLNTKTTPNVTQQTALANATLDGKYGDERDDVMLDGVSNNMRSSTVVTRYPLGT